MKKAVLMLFALMLAFVGFGQEVEPVAGQSAWYTSTEFLVVLGGAALLVIEWILRAVPTSKPIGFALKAISMIIQWLINRVPDKKKVKQ